MNQRGFLKFYSEWRGLHIGQIFIAEHNLPILYIHGVDGFWWLSATSLVNAASINPRPVNVAVDG